MCNKQISKDSYFRGWLIAIISSMLFSMSLVEYGWGVPTFLWMGMTVWWGTVGISEYQTLKNQAKK